MIFDYVKKYYQEAEYPALAFQADVWGRIRPLEGMKILDATPVFRNTVLKYAALIAAGAELTAGISEVMPYDREILESLRAHGLKVVHADNDDAEEHDVILDCAGAFSKWPAKYGVSELTRSGAHVYADAGMPVFLADEGRIKRIETCLGTGDGFIRAMEQLGFTRWKGRRIVVFGSGKVGTGIIYRAAKAGAEIDVVTEPETISPLVRELIHEVADFKDNAKVIELLDGAYAIVTATGHKGIVEKYGIADRIISGGTLLANMGVEDEFGDAFPASSALNGKKPLNFMLEEPTQVKYIDATMALHNEGAVWLLKESRKAGIIIPPSSIEDSILETTRINGLISDELDII